MLQDPQTEKGRPWGTKSAFFRRKEIRVSLLFVFNLAIPVPEYFFSFHWALPLSGAADEQKMARMPRRKKIQFLVHACQGVQKF
jgi:hypothetical protein